MSRWLMLAVLVLALAGAGVATLWAWPIGETPQLDAIAGDAAQGAYLARMSGCIACHTNVKGGGKPLAGGLALNTKFGTFYSPNLTSDKDQGIGDWSVEEFAKAVRQGVAPDGQSYYPAFPFPFYAKFSDQDIANLWAAFQTVPAADEPSKPHTLKFPFSYRELMKPWRGLFLRFAAFQPNPEKSDAWNRGEFIVKGPAHCGACHTPRNVFGARDLELQLHGSDDLPDGGKAPAINLSTLKEEGWTRTDLAYSLKTGVKPDGDAFGGAMGEVVRDGTSFLTDADRNSIATYLLDEEETP